jgi:hypothetical protein
VAGRDEGGGRCEVALLVRWQYCCQNSTLTLSPTSKPISLCDDVFFVRRLYVTEATTRSLMNMYLLCIHIWASNKMLPKPPRYLHTYLSCHLDLILFNTQTFKRFLIKLSRFILKFSNTMQEGRLTFVFLFRHVGRATATGRYNVQIGHSYPYGTQTGLTSPGLI